jgi:NIMA-interacting peptidyl-prolyl cis-trans isomerase 1
MSSPLPHGWSEHASKSHPGKVYYVHVNGEKTWDFPTEDAVSTLSDQVRVLHLLRKHRGSRRPSSWRVETITQTKEEAIAQIEEFRITIAECGIKKGSAAMRGLFEEIARCESDCSSAHKSGDLGNFGRGAMQKAFEDASFALGVGELSGIVDTDSGIHIILRIA